MLRPIILAITVITTLAVWAGTANAASRDVTYTATLSPQGEVLLTLTPNLAGVTRAEIRDGLFTVVNPVTLQELTFRFAKHIYFDPPATVTGGQFSVTIPDQLAGMARDSVRIDGTLNNGRLSGTATLVACVYPSACFDAASETLTGARVIDTPPAITDSVHVGQIEEQGPARVIVAIDDDGMLTSLSLRNVVASACFEPSRPFNAHLFFDPPLPPGTTVNELIAPTLVRLAASFSSEGSRVSGDVSISNAIFDPVCVEHFVWSEPALGTPATATRPSATPTAFRPVLPPAGTTSPPSNSAPGWLRSAFLAAVGVVSIGLSCVLAPRRRARSRISHE